MQVRRVLWAGLALAALSGCRKEEAAGPEVYAPITGAPIQGVAAADQAREPSAAAAAQAQALPANEAVKIAVGMSRPELMTALGECALRTNFVPAGAPGQFTVESFQPKLGKCVEKFGQRQFQVVGGVLKTIRNGLSPPPPPPGAPPDSASSALRGPR